MKSDKQEFTFHASRITFHASSRMGLFMILLPFLSFATKQAEENRIVFFLLDKKIYLSYTLKGKGGINVAKRTKFDNVITVKLTTELAEAARQKANEESLYISEVVRKLLKEWVKSPSSEEMGIHQSLRSEPVMPAFELSEPIIDERYEMLNRSLTELAERVAELERMKKRKEGTVRHTT